ncbi:MAG: hypothetical protein ASARMPREDX12_002050 [Alectoria sarmentosa]|nr:MAG: hypothetical protein ASARMPREDX12_002050 [Alectoria sarmentosa]
MSTKTVDTTSAENEAHAALTPQEEIHCHKARIFSHLAKGPVVRGWKDAVCDGAVYLGTGSFPMSYADRYFRVSSRDISYVTFSIVTAFKESGLDADGQEIERSQCLISPAQREASEFLIVTFSEDRDRVALLPHREYWPVKGEEAETKPPPEEISVSTLFEYSFGITLLPAHIEEVKRSASIPMHPSTAPFQIGMDGRIPRAGTPKAIMPQALKQERAEPDQSIPASPQQEEEALRNIHCGLANFSLRMSADFLLYQPLMRDFRILVSKCKKFPDGLEVVINHKIGTLAFPKIGSTLEKRNEFAFQMEHADYLFAYTLENKKNFAMFVPQKFLAIDWSTNTMELSEVLDRLNQKHKDKRFRFEMGKQRWVHEVWKLICQHPPDEHPTPAEKMQEFYTKALPWPEIEAQNAVQNESTPQKARRDKGQHFSEHDSGTGDGDTVKSSDVSLLAAHYLEKASLDHGYAGDDAS